MAKDLDLVLQSWKFEPNRVQARLVTANDGREVLQIRIDLGILQLETKGRPDGARPHGHATYADYLRSKVRRKRDFIMNEEECQEADREFVQYYHRRIAWLALRRFHEAVADADHTLAFMDLVRSHSPSAEYTAAHEQYRNFVCFHRTQASAARFAEEDRPEDAIEEIRRGLSQMREHFVENELEEQMESDALVVALRQLESSLRELHGIEATLQERLEAAIHNEQYETAAKLRDELRRRQ